MWPSSKSGERARSVREARVGPPVRVEPVLVPVVAPTPIEREREPKLRLRERLREPTLRLRERLREPKLRLDELDRNPREPPKRPPRRCASTGAATSSTSAPKTTAIPRRMGRPYPTPRERGNHGGQRARELRA
jgi:hypothetical protein